MPGLLNYVNSSAAVCYAGQGAVDGDEILAAARRVESLARSAPIEYLLVDLTGIAEFGMSTDNVRDLAGITRAIATLAPGVRVAIVAPQDHLFGLGRMWGAFMEGSTWNVQICRTPAAAADWLGVLPDPDDGVPIDDGPAAPTPSS
jgi:hypothetical protein